MKEQFLELLKTVKREGIEELISFLEKSDFFVAPASTRFHGDHVTKHIPPQTSPVGSSLAGI